MKNTAVNLLVAIFLVIISATAAKAQMSEAQKEMIRADFNRDVLQAGDAVITADEFAPLTSSDAKVYKKWVKGHTKLIKVGDSSVVYTRATLGEQLDSGLDTFTVTNVVMPVRLLKMSTLRKTHSKDEQIPFFTFFSKDEKTERPIIILSSTTGGDKSKARSLEVAMAEVRESEPAVATTNDVPKTEPKSAQAEEGDEEDQDRSGNTKKLSLNDMLKLTLDRQAVRHSLPGMCWFTFDKINGVTGSDPDSIRFFAKLDTATYRSLDNPLVDTVLYNQLVMGAFNCNGGRMYFGTVDTTTYLMNYVYQDHKEKPKAEPEIKDADLAKKFDAKADERKSKSGETPVKTDKGSTDESGEDTADAGETKSAEGDTLGGKFRHEVLGNPGRNAFVLFDPKNAQAIFNPDPKWGYYFNPETGLTTPLGSKFFKRQFRLARRGAFDPFGYAAFGDEYAPMYPSYGYGYSSNYGLMGGGGWNHGYGGGYGGCFGGYNSYRGGIYGTTFAMDYNSGCTGFLHSGPMWARRQCYGLNYDPCTSCNTYYNDVNVSVGAGAGIWVGAGAGTEYRSASAGDGDVVSEALVINTNAAQIKKEIAAAQAKAKSDSDAKRKASMQNDIREAKQLAENKRQEAVNRQQMQAEMQQFMQAETARQNETANRESMRAEISQAVASNQSVNREREASKTPKPMDIRPTAAASSTSNREKPTESAIGIRPAGTQDASRGKNPVRENTVSADRGNNRPSQADRPTHVESTRDRGNHNARPQSQGSVKPAREVYSTQVEPTRDRGNHHLPQQMQSKPQRGDNHMVRPSSQRPGRPAVQPTPRPQRERPATVRGGNRGGGKPTVMRGKGRTGGQMRQGKR